MTIFPNSYFFFYSSFENLSTKQVVPRIIEKLEGAITRERSGEAAGRSGEAGGAHGRWRSSGAARRERRSGHVSSGGFSPPKCTGRSSLLNVRVVWENYRGSLKKVLYEWWRTIFDSTFVNGAGGGLFLLLQVIL